MGEEMCDASGDARLHSKHRIAIQGFGFPVHRYVGERFALTRERQNGARISSKDERHEKKDEWILK
jgi:hypothetical protein